MKLLLATLSLFSLLASCANEPSFGDRLVARGESTSQIGEQWNKGAELVVEGERQMKRGRKLVEEGESLIRTGEKNVERGKKLQRESEASAGS